MLVRFQSVNKNRMQGFILILENPDHVISRKDLPGGYNDDTDPVYLKVVFFSSSSFLNKRFLTTCYELVHTWPISVQDVQTA